MVRRASIAAVLLSRAFVASVLFASVLLAGPPACAQAPDAVFDVPAILATRLDARTLQSFEREGIVTEEVRFHSERDGDVDVDIFAYFSYPRDGEGLPAYIWNPGGLGQASPAFTEVGARRGYATLCIDFPQRGYRSTGGYDINSGLTLPADPRQAPIYHGAVALLKAVSYLESRAEVDKNRIGMAGSSWGGFFTTLMVGIDSRLKVGSSMYGCGALQLGNAWWDGDSRNGREAPPPEERERWRITLDPAGRLPTQKTPIGWFTGTNDRFYLLSALMQSHAMAAGPRHLSLVANWDHALPVQLSDELFLAWLDEHLQGKRSLPRVTPLEICNEDGRLIARWTFEGNAASASLIASYGEAGNWRGRFWHTFPAQIEGTACRAELPAGALPCYASGGVTNPRGLISSTALARIDAAALGVQATSPTPDYDGCQEWGGFEEDQVAYLARHDRSGQTRWVPRVSTDAKQGAHAAILEPGVTVLPPILSTATVAHRFACSLKADKPVSVSVQLAGESKQFTVGAEWTEIQMDHTPPQSLMGGVSASVTAPGDATVLIDAVSFHPAP